MRPVRSAVATALRFGLGRRAGAVAARPADALELYEFEACPFCRKTRVTGSVGSIRDQVSCSHRKA